MIFEQFRIGTLMNNLGTSIINHKFIYYAIMLLGIACIFAIFKIILGKSDGSAFEDEAEENSSDKTQKEKNDLNIINFTQIILNRNDYFRKKVFKKDTSDKPRHNFKNSVFIIDFHGDSDATAAETLDPIIDTILTNHKAGDKVLVRLDSGGGYVDSYGLASMKLKRLRDVDTIELVISVDYCAASGGYMMACVADKLICSPFATIGSIGVVIEFLNYFQLLKKLGIEEESLTAGAEKRLLTSYGENTDEKRAIIKSELKDTHEIMKQWILTHRPFVNIEVVATGKTWKGITALDLKLVDKLQTSGEFLYELEKSGKFKLFVINIVKKQRKNTPTDSGNIIDALKKIVDNLIQSDQRRIK